MTRTVRGTLLALFVLAPVLAAAAPASADISIAPPASYDVFDGTPVGALPNPVVVTGDVNGDGHADAVATDGNQTIRVALGSLAGLGATTTALTDVHGTNAVALGDVNGDGKLDVVTIGSQDLHVALGHGDGTFSGGFVSGGGDGDGATALAVGDVDRDGDVDVVSTDPTGVVVVNYNNGSGDFSTQTHFSLPSPAAPSQVSLADVDRDGVLDLVFTDWARGGARIALGNGDGTFTATPEITPIAYSGGLAVADVNRDGKLDLVGLSRDVSPTVSVALGDGAGAFGAATSTALGLDQPAGLAVGDLDHDAVPDIAVGGLHGIETLAGHGDGTFAPPVTQTSAWSTAIGLADVDADGKPDVVLLNKDGDTLQVARNTSTVPPPNFLGAAPQLPATSNGPAATTIADVNRDGVPDVLVAEQTASRIGVFLGVGNGTYAARADYWPGGNSPTNVVAADVNGDGKLDLVTGNALSSSIGVMLGVGDGTFGAASVIDLSLFNNPTGIDVADVNRDGKLDIVSVSDVNSPKTSVLLGNGNGTFQPATHTSFSGASAGVRIGDYNRDGKPDLAVLGNGASKVYILIGNGDGTFGAPVPYSLPSFSSPQAIAVADLDQDGKLDLVTANYGASSVSVLRGNGDGTFQGRTDTAVSGSPRGLAVGDIDGDGVPDVAATDGAGPAVMTIAHGNGDGTLGATKTVAIGASSYGLAIGDVNRDGRGDVVAPSYTEQKLYVLLGGLDQTPPTTTDNVPVGWSINGRVTLTALDSGAGVDKTYYTTGADPLDPSTSSAVYNPSSGVTLSNGQKVKYFSTDKAGNAEAVHTSAAIQVDGVSPMSTASTVPTAWQRAPVEVTITATDALSGVASTLYRKTTSANCNGGSPTTPYSSSSKPTLANGERLCFRSIDVAGNQETVRSAGPAKVDTAVPTVSDDVPTGWRTAPVTVTLNAADTGGSGLDKVYYEVGASPDAPTTGSSVYSAASKPVLQDGEKISYVAYDVAGNDSGVRTSAAAQVDGLAPTTTDDVPTGWQAAPVTVTLSPVDTGGSGVAATHYEIGASPATPTSASPVYDPADRPVLHDGEKISYFSTDVAGNAGAVQTSTAAMVDSAVPDTALGDAPADLTTDRRPTVTFTTTAVDATFECALDGEPFAACTSPFEPATDLPDGPHAIEVRAVSRALLPDPTPARAAFVVDATAPDAPVLVAGPPASATATTASLTFSGEADATFACAVDGEAAAPCTPPLTLTGLAVGDHTVVVTQTDAAGNTGPPLTVRFTVVKEPEPGDGGSGDVPPGDGGTPPPSDPGSGPGAPGDTGEATRLTPLLDAPDGAGRHPAVLVAGTTAIACQANRSTLVACRVEARSVRSLRTAGGRRLRAGTVLATGGSAAGIAPARTLAASLTLTAAGRSALARHPLGLTARVAFVSTTASGRSVSATTRVRLLADSALVVSFAGRGRTLPANAKKLLARLVRTVPVAKAVRCIADTDASGDAAADRALTRTQATAACAYLRSRGLKARRTVEGRGSTRPRATNRTAKGRALNRRLTIRITLAVA